MEATLEGTKSDFQDESSEKTIFFQVNLNKYEIENTDLVEREEYSHEPVLICKDLSEDSEKPKIYQLEDPTSSPSHVKDSDQTPILDSPIKDYDDILNSELIEIVRPENCENQAQILEPLTPEISNKEEDSSAIKDFENSVEDLFKIPPSRFSRISNKTHQLTSSCKKKLKKIKKTVAQSPGCYYHFENAVNKSRAYLQTTFKSWGDRRERILRSWMGKVKSSASLLCSLLQEVWDNA